MDNHPRKTVFKEYIHPLDLKVVQKMIDHAKLDKYVKKLNSLSFLRLFLYAQLKGLSSLGRISDKVNRKKSLQRAAGLTSISKSQLSRRLRDLPPEIFQVILQHLVQKLHQEMGPWKAEKVLGKIHLIDSSTISMCLSQYRWADFRETKAGVKLHTSLVFMDGIAYPGQVILTPARPADVTQLDALVGKTPGALHVFDRGYFDFEKFDTYCSQGIRFVTRLKSNTIVHVIEELPVDSGSPIDRKAIVRIGKMRHPLLLVETHDGEGKQLTVVCNDLGKSAEEIGDLYRTRWQIELFFKWCKQHLILKKLYGKSRNAVFNQIYIAMIAYCLTLLMKQRVGYPGSLLNMFNWIGDLWTARMTRFIRKIFQKPERSSEGRRRLNHEQVFEETLAQYESGDISHLDDLTYDPLFC
ncbi:IS4 family transposase [Mycobacterium tuberculosis]|uniref:IS4 family transposase n=1 Tax=Mycobacterium tuberculosis TaxID=1773 RepID=UPI0028765675|nr:IS4 family transposase [Mycobacterium tuberculosis]MDS0320933.1 IS4 family transposase [Mycobacterium tuberculosis]